MGRNAETEPGSKRHLHIIGAAIMTATGVFWLLAALEPRFLAILLMFGGVVWHFGSRVVYRRRDKRR